MLVVEVPAYDGCDSMGGLGGMKRRHAEFLDHEEYQLQKPSTSKENLDHDYESLSETEDENHGDKTGKEDENVSLDKNGGKVSHSLSLLTRILTVLLHTAGIHHGSNAPESKHRLQCHRI